MTLFPNTHQPERWTIVQISDTHLMDQDDLEFVHMNPEHSFHAVMQDITQQYPQADAIFHTGDLAQVPVAATYQRYLKFMQALNIPHYQIPGNHDDAEVFPFYVKSNQVHAIELGNWCVILLNTAVKNRVDGWMDAAQLQQLDQVLQQHAHQYVIIACHHHPFDMHSHWIDQHKLKNTEDLIDVLARHNQVKLVLCGHVHQDSLNQWQGIQFYSTPSTCVQFKPHSQHFALGTEAPGYRVLHLNADGSFSTQVHRVEHIVQQINFEISGY
ncbi:3',5'-cyclic-AMP phosphodiesterase [Acinetobacter sp. YH12237]|uniref:3',5'-cyclic-AMP phosphodiesterase n=1 Tax=Acinetobacter sp. YH12237 TaxID=2601164 RepID=UPI0015D30559|nr:3',5'-cyclic-AMP phosphodiesterase [Acinetobacter sp. YH12237]